MTADRLLEAVMDAHGGMKRWEAVSEIGAAVRSSGLLMRSKLKHNAFSEYGITAWRGEPRAVLDPYPKQGMRGVFVGDVVRIESRQGEVVEQRSGAREAFLGLRGRMRRAAWWDDLDALYFAGYAMWNYLNLPFLLADPRIEVEEGKPLRRHGDTWRRLDARFPEGFHTHSRKQSFYFDHLGLLRRHDYSPDVISPFANAARMCERHREYGELIFATRHRVTPKGPRNRPLPQPVVVTIDLDEIRAH
jgi:hypothetical protein